MNLFLSNETDDFGLYPELGCQGCKVVDVCFLIDWYSDSIALQLSLLHSELEASVGGVRILLLKEKKASDYLEENTALKKKKKKVRTKIKPAGCMCTVNRLAQGLCSAVTPGVKWMMLTQAHVLVELLVKRTIYFRFPDNILWPRSQIYVCVPVH